MADDDIEPVGRATTALVYRSVDELGKRMDVHFDGVKQRLDRIEPVEARVDGHDRILANHEVRLLTVEENRKADRELATRTNSERTMWRKVQRPTLFLTILALIVAIVVPFLT